MIKPAAHVFEANASGNAQDQWAGRSSMLEFGAERFGDYIEVLGLDSHDHNIILGKVKSNLL